MTTDVVGLRREWSVASRGAASPTSAGDSKGSLDGIADALVA